MSEQVSITKMSSRGQVVVPEEIRSELHIEEGTVFFVYAQGDSIILKKANIPKKQDVFKRLEESIAKTSAKVKALGIKEEDVVSIIHERRRKDREGRT